MKYPDVHIPEEKLTLILKDIGIEISGQTSTDIIAYCPFHDNKDTPAFNISKNKSHLWKCWNAGCSRRGNIFTLIQLLQDISPYESLDLVKEYEVNFVLPTFPDQTPDREYDTLDESILNDFSYSIYDLSYMQNRGFNEDTIKHFKIGRIGNYITIPVWDEENSLVGISKRSVVPSKQKYLDSGLPKRHILFNLQNAVRPNQVMGEASSEVIVVEGPFDAMRVHQAGFTNVVATLCGDLTKSQARLLRTHFSSVIIFTDNDEAGRKLGEKIERECNQMKVFWVKYPEGIKDPGEMSEEAIQKAINNKRPNILRKLNQILGGKS